MFFLSMALRVKGYPTAFIRCWPSMARRRTTDAVLRLLTRLWGLVSRFCIEKSEDA